MPVPLPLNLNQMLTPPRADWQHVLLTPRCSQVCMQDIPEL